VRITRTALELGGPAGAQSQHLVGLGLPALDIVRDEHAGAAGRAADQRLEQRYGAGVDPGHRLVEEQERRIVQHRPRGGTRWRIRRENSSIRSSGTAREATASEQLVDAVVAHAVQAGVEREVLARAHRLVQKRLVPEVADLPADLPGLVRELRSQHPDRSRMRAQQGREHLQQGRLAAPFGRARRGCAIGKRERHAPTAPRGRHSGAAELARCRAHPQSSKQRYPRAD